MGQPAVLIIQGPAFPSSHRAAEAALAEDSRAKILIVNLLCNLC
jgi:hypothetical protein